MHQPGSALTIAHARAELAAGLAAIARGETELDLAGVTEVDSSAVATLLAWQRAAREKGRALVVRNMPESMRSLAGLYGVSDLIKLGRKVTSQEILAEAYNDLFKKYGRAELAPMSGD